MKKKKGKKNDEFRSGAIRGVHIEASEEAYIPPWLRTDPNVSTLKGCFDSLKSKKCPKCNFEVVLDKQQIIEVMDPLLKKVIKDISKKPRKISSEDVARKCGVNKIVLTNENEFKKVKNCIYCGKKLKITTGNRKKI